MPKWNPAHWKLKPGKFSLQPGGTGQDVLSTVQDCMVISWTGWPDMITLGMLLLVVWLYLLYVSHA